MQKFEDLNKCKEISKDDHELDEYLTKLYEKNMERIVNLSKIIQVSQVIGISSFLIFLILLAFRSSQTSNFSVFYLLFPSTVCLISFTVLLNMYLKLKEIFDEAEKDREDDNSSQIGSILTYFSLNTCAISILAYLILICLRIEGFINSQWNVMTIPLYLATGIAIFYWIFILPAFLQNKLYFEISIIFAYLVCGLVFTIMFNFKLDKSYSSSYFNILIPLLFALGFHFILNILSLFSLVKQQIFSTICVILFLFLSFTSFVLVGLKADGKFTGYEFWLPIIIFTVGYSLLVGESLYRVFIDEKEEELECRDHDLV
jgi:hypothetical protein